MTRFLGIVDFVRDYYPLLWDSTTKRNRRIMVRYWMNCYTDDPVMSWNA